MEVWKYVWGPNEVSMWRLSYWPEFYVNYYYFRIQCYNYDNIVLGRTVVDDTDAYCDTKTRCNVRGVEIFAIIVVMLELDAPPEVDVSMCKSVWCWPEHCKHHSALLHSNTRCDPRQLEHRFSLLTTAFRCSGVFVRQFWQCIIKWSPQQRKQVLCREYLRHCLSAIREHALTTHQILTRSAQ